MDAIKQLRIQPVEHGFRVIRDITRDVDGEPYGAQETELCPTISAVVAALRVSFPSPKRSSRKAKP